MASHSGSIVKIDSCHSITSLESSQVIDFKAPFPKGRVQEFERTITDQKFMGHMIKVVQEEAL